MYISSSLYLYAALELPNYLSTRGDAIDKIISLHVILVLTDCMYRQSLNFAGLFISQVN